MNTASVIKHGVTSNGSRQLSIIMEQKLGFILKEARLIMKHCRRDKLTVADIERVMRLYHFDKMLDDNKGKHGVLKSCLLLQNPNGENDEVVPISDILESDIPDLPLETSFTIDWLAVDGEQVNFKRDFDEDEDNIERSPDIQLLSQSIHSLSFECELYLKNIKDRMYTLDGKNTEIFHQLQIDDGLKQICPYLVHWIQSKVQMIMKRKPSEMLSYLSYLIQVIHSLLMNRHLHIASYLHILVPCVLTCCVGKTLSATPADNHWELRTRASIVLAEINRQYSASYPNLQKQILITLNKVLHNPKSTLPSVFGVIQAITFMGEGMVRRILLPHVVEMAGNMNAILEKPHSATAEVQVHWCIHALIGAVGVVSQGVQRKLEVSQGCDSVLMEVEETMKQLPYPREILFSEAVLPLCYRHNENTWDICDYVI